MPEKTRKPQRVPERVGRIAEQQRQHLDRTDFEQHEKILV